MEDDKMITLAEAAAELGVVRATIHRYIKKYHWTVYRKAGDNKDYLKVSDIQQLKGFTPKEKAS